MRTVIGGELHSSVPAPGFRPQRGALEAGPARSARGTSASAASVLQPAGFASPGTLFPSTLLSVPLVKVHLGQGGISPLFWNTDLGSLSPQERSRLGVV